MINESTLDSSENDETHNLLIYDKKRLADLSKLAIGGRSLREFSKISGLSEGFLSRLTTGKLKSAPTKRSIVKLSSESSRPQNGVTLQNLMEAAGYKIDGNIKLGKTKSDSEKALNDYIYEAAFAPYLTASVLERSGQLEQDYTTRNLKDIFTITPKQGKVIVGIPAFCTSDNVNDEIQEIKWRLIMAFSIYGEESGEKFFVILTNQREIYDNFDKNKIVGTGGEFYIALTEDFRSFSRQRHLETVDVNGMPEKLRNRNAFYDFTAEGG